MHFQQRIFWPKQVLAENNYLLKFWGEWGQPILLIITHLLSLRNLLIDSFRGNVFLLNFFCQFLFYQERTEVRRPQSLIGRRLIFCVNLIFSQLDIWNQSWIVMFLIEAVLYLPGWVGGWVGGLEVIIKLTQFNCYCNCLLELRLAKKDGEKERKKIKIE